MRKTSRILPQGIYGSAEGGVPEVPTSLGRMGERNVRKVLEKACLEEAICVLQSEQAGISPVRWRKSISDGGTGSPEAEAGRS